MLTIELGKITNATKKAIEAFEIHTLEEFPGTEIATLNPLEERVLSVAMHLQSLRDHEGGSTTLFIRNKLKPEEELLIKILWAGQESGLGFFIDMTAQNRVTDWWEDVEGVRIDGIVPARNPKIQFDVIVAGDAFEKSSVKATVV